ncbi:MAG TPA: hypothetical protein VNA68_01720 [Candidatus Dormibacteraeota bacterium]|nr:hypothetical protein [Candidatus Dormibacteraeota bacterium]
MTTATYAIRRNQNLYRSKSQINFGPVSLSFVAVAAIAVLALLYLTQITKTSVFGYKVTELEQQRNTALQAKQALEVEAARLSSIQNIQSSKAVEGMEPETRPTYVKQ